MFDGVSNTPFNVCTDKLEKVAPVKFARILLTIVKIVMWIPNSLSAMGINLCQSQEARLSTSSYCILENWYNICGSKTAPNQCDGATK